MVITGATRVIVPSLRIMVITGVTRLVVSFGTMVRTGVIVPVPGPSVCVMHVLRVPVFGL